MEKELLFSVTRKDFDVTWFSGTGAGGQYRNKRQNCCRIVHRDSGAMGTGQSQRDRPANQKEAFNNCVKSLSFKAWLNRKIYEYDSTESVEDLVNAAMQDGKIKVEYKKDDKWVEEVLDKR